MKPIMNTWGFIRKREPLILSLLIHLLICIIFIHTLYFLPNQEIEDANAAFLILNEGDNDSCLKYQDKSLVDQITMKNNELPQPEIKHAPILPEVNFRKGTNIRDELKYIGRYG